MLNFNRIFLLYFCVMILFIVALCVDFKMPETSWSNQDKVVTSNTLSPSEKTIVTQHLVDQLVENNNSYENNVWTTLATIMLAIGMLLGSDKFSAIVSEHKGSVQAIHWIVFILFCLHLVAYYFYQLGSETLLSKMYAVGNDLTYYKKYAISDVRLILNSVFDFFMFLLLSFIVDSFRHSK